MVVEAQAQARNEGANVIDTRDLLFGLLAAEGSLAAESLLAAGVNRDKLQEASDRYGGSLESNEAEWGVTSPSGQVPFTVLAKQTLEMALREALTLGHNYIGTEHILLALSQAAQNGSDADQVMSIVINRSTDWWAPAVDLVKAALTNQRKTAPAEPEPAPEPVKVEMQLAFVNGDTLLITVDPAWLRGVVRERKMGVVGEGDDEMLINGAHIVTAKRAKAMRSGGYVLAGGGYTRRVTEHNT